MNKEILRLAVPNIVSNISVPLISTVDTLLMGHLSGLHLGAVGIGSMIFNFLYWNFAFLRMGTTGLTAQSFGKNDEQEMATILGRAMITAIGIGLLMIVLQGPFWDLGAVLMNVSEAHYDIVEKYFRIRMYAAPATLSLYVLMGWYFGMQNAIIPLVITIFLNLVNILISALLVLSFGFEVEGVAYGTMAAQYLGLIFAILLLFRKYRHIPALIKTKYLFLKEAFYAFFRLNRDIFIRTLCLSFVFAFFYSMSSKSGEHILAASVILLQFLNWMSYGIDGFAYAAESLTGKYHGAGNVKKLNKAIRYSFYWGAAMALLFTVVFWLGEDQLILAFNDEVAVVQSTRDNYIWIIILPILGFGSYIWDGIFVGLTASRSMRNSMFLSFIVFFGLYYSFNYLPGIQSLWIALLGFLVARAFFQSALYFKYGNKLR